MKLDPNPAQTYLNYVGLDKQNLKVKVESMFV